MITVKNSENIRYIGVDDKNIDLFESQYEVPNGMSYNSYVILDEKTAVIDTVDFSCKEQWEENLKNALSGREADYLVISHMEPDHAGCIKEFIKLYPNTVLVGNAKTFVMFSQFFDDLDISGKTLTVKEGDTLNLGEHTLTFYMAPMVHWPEVMVSYETKEKVLFSADAFGKFGTLDTEEDWACEARRYYFNICGKYGQPVSTLLKKADGLDIEAICPLHGPVLSENLEYYIGKYKVWSSYEPEDKGVLIAYASIHGNTKQAAYKLADILKNKGEEKVVVSDLSRDDISEVIEDAFRYDRIILASSSYDAGVFPPMEAFLAKLKAKAYQKRTAGIIENGSWAPSAGRVIKEALSAMKEITVAEPVVSIKSALKEADVKQLEELADAVIKRA